MQRYRTTGRMEPYAASGQWMLEADAQKLADALQAICNEANSRGELSPGGCDQNTSMAHLYGQAQEVLADFNFKGGV